MLCTAILKETTYFNTVAAADYNNKINFTTTTTTSNIHIPTADFGIFYSCNQC